MADTLLSTVTMKYTPATSSNTVENPVIYNYTAAPTQKVSGFITTTTTPLTISLSTFTTNTMVTFVANLDTTNNLNVTLRPNGQSSNTTFVVQPGGQFKFDGQLVLAQNLALSSSASTVQAFYYVAGT